MSADSWRRYKQTWCRFCQTQRLQPGQEPQKSDFVSYFMHLHRTKGQSYNAIKGYLSALNKFMMAIFGYR